jgi:hypothetical protein
MTTENIPAGDEAKTLELLETYDKPNDPEDRAYDEQFALIKEVAGKAAADNANYGWCVVENDDGSLDIQTKVYGRRSGVVNTFVSADGTIEHDWQED